MQPKYGPVGLLVSISLYGHHKDNSVGAYWNSAKPAGSNHSIFTDLPMFVTTPVGRSVSTSAGDRIDLPPGQTALHLMP